MIPRTIHYCWFGSASKPKLVRRCIESWGKYCPDYEVVEWSGNNFDFAQHPYLQWCCQNRKWAFLSDFARLIILEKYGGVYLDTDVELIRPLDGLLKYDAYFGFEDNQHIATGLGFGCIPHHPAVAEMMERYRSLMPDANGGFPTIPCPKINTEALLPYGLILNGRRQTVLGAEILPSDFLNPYDDPTGRLRRTENTYSIHWYGKSWMDQKTIFRSKIMKPLHRIFGTDFALFRLMRKRK